MANPVSPKGRALSPEEKKARDDALIDELGNFSEKLEGMVEHFTNLMRLSKELGEAGPGSQLVWRGSPYGDLHFNKRHLRSANSVFTRELRDLKKYIKVCGKKKREKVKPESFSGTYSPVYAGPALRAFFGDLQGFGPITPNHPNYDAASGSYLAEIDPAEPEFDPTTNLLKPLMSYLPRVQEGYFMRNTCTMLFYFHSYAQRLRVNDNNWSIIKSSPMMDYCFGGDIPATIYSRKLADGKTSKTLMYEAVGKEVDGVLIEAPLNTYDVIRLSYPMSHEIAKKRFDPTSFHTFYFQNFASPNYLSQTLAKHAEDLAAQPEYAAVYGDMVGVAANLGNKSYRDDMLQEHTLVKEVSQAWKAALSKTRQLTKVQKKKAANK